MASFRTSPRVDAERSANCWHNLNTFGLSVCAGPTTSRISLSRPENSETLGKSIMKASSGFFDLPNRTFTLEPITACSERLSGTR